MRKLLFVGILFSTIIVIQGCATTSKEISNKPTLRDIDSSAIEIDVNYIKVARPEKPKYERLDPNQHIGSSYNSERIWRNFDICLQYIEKLEGVITSYETQSIDIGE